MCDVRRVYYEICMLSDDHAVELSNELLACDTNVRHIHFRWHIEANFTDEGLKAIARGMRGHPELQTLLVWDKVYPLSDSPIVEAVKVLYLEGNLQNLDEISINSERAQFLFDCFRVEQNDKRMRRYYIPTPSRYSTEFAACLHGNTELQQLSINIEYSFTSPVDAHALAAAMCNSQTTDLLLRNGNPRVTMHGGDDLRVFCQDGIQASGRVWKCLKLKMCFVHADYMIPVAEVIPFVKTLQISQVGEKLQTKAEMHCLYEGLERSCNLVGLKLTHCRLDANDMMMLSRALRNHRSLKALNLDWNEIGDAGVTAFVQRWDEHHPLLESLELFANEIGHTGAQELMNAVTNRHSMKVLEMDGNRFGYGVFEMIGEHLPNLRLKVLDLRGFTNNKDGKQSAYQSLLRGLRGNHFLHELKLSHNFDKEFGNDLSFYVELSKHGRYLVTDINAVALSIWCTILAKCGRHFVFSNSMMFYFLKEQPHLVRRAQSMVVE